MIAHKETIVNLIGKEKYDEELDVLTKVMESEAKKGKF